MKKINSKNQLLEEKRLLRQRQADLEQKIKTNWSDLKHTLKPSSLAREAVDGMLHNRTDEPGKDEGLLKSTLVYGITTLAKKLVEKASNRFGSSSGTES